jgi:hypothetical protein
MATYNDKKAEIKYNLDTVNDSIVISIVDKFITRSRFGFEKYGTSLDRTDLNVLDWIKHAQEEHMDAILYLEKLKTMLQPENAEKAEETI